MKLYKLLLHVSKVSLTDFLSVWYFNGYISASWLVDNIHSAIFIICITCPDKGNLLRLTIRKALCLFARVPMYEQASLFHCHYRAFWKFFVVLWMLGIFPLKWHCWQTVINKGWSSWLSKMEGWVEKRENWNWIVCVIWLKLNFYFLSVWLSS